MQLQRRIKEEETNIQTNNNRNKKKKKKTLYREVVKNKTLYLGNVQLQKPVPWGREEEEARKKKKIGARGRRRKIEREESTRAHILLF